VASAEWNCDKMRVSRGSLPSGVLAPLTTPFDSHGEIDEAAFRAEVEWLVAGGVDGVVIGGSTGEGYALSPDELEQLVRLAFDVVSDGVQVVAGIIADSSRAAASIAAGFDRFPLTAIQVTPPHYIFAPDDDGMVDFYTAVAAATSAPVVIYNVIPWLQLSPVLVERIMGAHPRVIGVKHSQKKLDSYRDLVGCVGADRVFAAIDNRLADCYAIGAAGSIAAISAAVPSASVRLHRAVRAGDAATAGELAAFLEAVWKSLDGPNLPARVKAAQAAQGMASGYARAPMREVSEAERAAIAEVLRRLPALGAI